MLRSKAPDQAAKEEEFSSGDSSRDGRIPILNLFGRKIPIPMVYPYHHGAVRAGAKRVRVRVALRDALLGVGHLAPRGAGPRSARGKRFVKQPRTLAMVDKRRQDWKNSGQEWFDREQLVCAYEPSKWIFSR